MPPFFLTHLSSSYSDISGHFLSDDKSRHHHLCNMTYFGSLVTLVRIFDFKGLLAKYSKVTRRFMNFSVSQLVHRDFRQLLGPAMFGAHLVTTIKTKTDLFRWSMLDGNDDPSSSHQSHQYYLIHSNTISHPVVINHTYRIFQQVSRWNPSLRFQPQTPRCVRESLDPDRRLRQRQCFPIPTVSMDSPIQCQAAFLHRFGRR